MDSSWNLHKLSASTTSHGKEFLSSTAGCVKNHHFPFLKTQLLLSPPISFTGKDSKQSIPAHPLQQHSELTPHYYLLIIYYIHLLITPLLCRAVCKDKAEKSFCCSASSASK